MKRLNFLIILAIVCLAGDVFAAVDLGTKLSCEGTSIIAANGAPKAFAVIKQTLSAKINKAKSKLYEAQIAAAPKVKLEKLSQKLKDLKNTKKQAKACSRGELVSSISPLWASVAGTFTGPYEVTSLGNGTMSVTNSLSGNTHTTTITFLTGLVTYAVSGPTVFQIQVNNIAFPIKQYVPGTPLGNLNVTILENGHINITTTLVSGVLAGFALEFNGQFTNDNFDGVFELGEGDFVGSFNLQR